MIEVNKLRWERIDRSNVTYDYIKLKIKEIYNYEVKEDCLMSFIDNIKNYTDIDEGELLHFIEDVNYSKVSILSMKDLKKYNEHPIYDCLTNVILREQFKMDNRIHIKPKEIYKGKLDSCYKIIYYDDEINNKFEIKLACIKEFENNVIDSYGMESKDMMYIYDCFKCIIDLKKKVILLFYSDINSQLRLHSARKIALYNLFTNVNKNNLVKYDISRNLNKYFTEYIEERTNKNIKKLISIIETYSVIEGKKNAIRSVDENYIHKGHRLKAIEDSVKNEGHIVSILECKINSNVIKFKYVGEIVLQNTVFYQEVIESVCNEMFNGYNPCEKI